MKKFYIGATDLKVNKDVFDKVIKELYMRFYKKDHLRHTSRHDKRLPSIKITADIFSSCIYFKDKSQKELRVFLDGTCHLNQLAITSITIEGEEFNKQEYEAILDILKSISTHAVGYVLYSNDSKIGRVKNGEVTDEKGLLQELKDLAQEEPSSELEDIYQWRLEFHAED